jgi:very-short-patch-repair endonuclease
MEQKQFAKTLRHNMTEAEQRLWLHLRAHRMAGQKFRRQQPIGPYVVDFVHFGARVVVEADGGQHNESPADAARDAWLSSQGFKVLRFWNDQILKETEAVLTTIWAAVSDAPSPRRTHAFDPPPRGGRGDQR